MTEVKHAMILPGSQMFGLAEGQARVGWTEERSPTVQLTGGWISCRQPNLRARKT